MQLQCNYATFQGWKSHGQLDNFSCQVDLAHRRADFDSFEIFRQLHSTDARTPSWWWCACVEWRIVYLSRVDVQAHFKGWASRQQPTVLLLGLSGMARFVPRWLPDSFPASTTRSDISLDGSAGEKKRHRYRQTLSFNVDMCFCLTKQPSPHTCSAIRCCDMSRSVNVWKVVYSTKDRCYWSNAIHLSRGAISGVPISKLLGFVSTFQNPLFCQFFFLYHLCKKNSRVPTFTSLFFKSGHGLGRTENTKKHTWTRHRVSFGFRSLCRHFQFSFDALTWSFDWRQTTSTTNWHSVCKIAHENKSVNAMIGFLPYFATR